MEHEIQHQEVKKTLKHDYPAQEQVISVFCERFNSLLNAHNFPPKGSGRDKKLATLFGMTSAGARKWTEGFGLPSTRQLLMISQYFRVSIDWLLGNDIADESEKPEVTVPILLALGAENDVSAMQCVGNAKFESDWLSAGVTTSDKLALVVVNSDAMVPSLRKKDILLVDLSVQHEIEENSIYVLVYKNATLVRRLQPRIDGTVLVLCDNSKYQPETVSSEKIYFNQTESFVIDSKATKNHVVILGKALWAIKRFIS